ncbi:hypothetical protein KJ652_01680 [Patescibacteria group bacterium]|nr:hypothetical protein [Patescibacteria group bacterium]MBU1123274.1 hypothetical protein [Patescibacteria group bacterium]MBU1911145.1 hypothetical protein [Patescibacteria group bacterium]
MTSTNPVRQFSAENVTVSVFCNETISNGKTRTFYSVSCRTFYYNNGKRKYMTSINERSVLTASMLLDLAYAWIVEHRSIVKTK